jgi:hypothetical protein
MSLAAALKGAVADTDNTTRNRSSTGTQPGILI